MTHHETKTGLKSARSAELLNLWGISPTRCEINFCSLYRARFRSSEKEFRARRKFRLIPIPNFAVVHLFMHRSWYSSSRARAQLFARYSLARRLGNAITTLWLPRSRRYNNIIIGNLRSGATKPLAIAREIFFFHRAFRFDKFRLRRRRRDFGVVRGEDILREVLSTTYYKRA